MTAFYSIRGPPAGLLGRISRSARRIARVPTSNLPDAESWLKYGTSMLNSILRVAPFFILLAVVAIRVRQGKIQPAEIGWCRPRSFHAAAGWWLLFVAIAFGWEFLLWSQGLLELGGFKHHGLEAGLRIVTMLLLAPVAEELIFRGLFLNFLTRKLDNPHLAVVLQALVFVALHNFTYQGTFVSNVGVAQSFIDACLFAYARRHTNSIFTPIAMHVTGNAIAVIEMLS